MAEKKTVKIVQEEEKPIEREVMAASLIKLSDAADKLMRSGLSQGDLVALIQRRCKGLGFNDISRVLDGIDALRKQYGA